MPNHDHHKAAAHHVEAARSHLKAAETHEQGDTEHASQHSQIANEHFEQGSGSVKQGSPEEQGSEKRSEAGYRTVLTTVPHSFAHNVGLVATYDRYYDSAELRIAEVAVRHDKRGCRASRSSPVYLVGWRRTLLTPTTDRREGTGFPQPKMRRARRGAVEDPNK
jgi:hypothetical protein